MDVGIRQFNDLGDDGGEVGSGDGLLEGGELGEEEEL